MTEDLLGRRLVVVTGKGGVGKSSVAAGLALATARLGKRVLLLQPYTRERSATILGLERTGSVPVKVGHLGVSQASQGAERNTGDGGSVWVLHMTPEAALREYGILKLKMKSLYRAVFENRPVRCFMGLVPGLPELLLLGKTWYHVQQQAPDKDGPLWDAVILDGPTTGHAVPFFRIPQVVLDLFGSGPMAEDARNIQDLITDPEKTCVHVVTLPEELPLREAGELRQTLVGELGMPGGVLFVNQVCNPCLSRKTIAQMEGVVGAMGDAGEDPFWKTAQLAVRQYKQTLDGQQYHLQTAEDIDAPIVYIPLMVRQSPDPSMAMGIARAVEAGFRKIGHQGRAFSNKDAVCSTEQ